MVYCNHNTETAKGGQPHEAGQIHRKGAGPQPQPGARDHTRRAHFAERRVCRAPDAHVPEGAAVACGETPLCAKQFVYIMLDKPKGGVVSAAEDARDSQWWTLVREAFPRRNLFPRGQAG